MLQTGTSALPALPLTLTAEEKCSFCRPAQPCIYSLCLFYSTILYSFKKRNDDNDHGLGKIVRPFRSTHYALGRYSSLHQKRPLSRPSSCFS